MYQTLLPLLLLAFTSVTALNVTQCDKANRYKNLSQRVKVSDCIDPPCILRKGSNVRVEMRFTPDYDVKNVKNDIKAYLTALPLIPVPFPGVDGNNACEFIFLASDHKKKVGCPLKANTEYLYRISFYMQNFYPLWTMDVKFGLLDARNNHLICFKVPAEIQSAEKDDEDDE